MRDPGVHAGKACFGALLAVGDHTDLVEVRLKCVFVPLERRGFILVDGTVNSKSGYTELLNIFK